MSARATPSDLGRGVYGPAEAARIAGLEPRRVRRWLNGYTFLARDGSERRSGPLVPQERDGDELVVSFADLVEVLFVKGFVDAGVPMHRVRAVHTEARAEFRTSHPFTLKRFEHDGSTIIERLRLEGAERLLDRYKAQYLMKAVMLPLMRRLDYDRLQKRARRYYPLGIDRPVVLDPQRSFGEATVARRGVPTRVLIGAHEAGDSLPSIARWYRLEIADVEAALEFEQQLRRGDRKAA